MKTGRWKLNEWVEDFKSGFVVRLCFESVRTNVRTNLGGALSEAALAFGRVNMMYHGNNHFSIINDKSSRFDFVPLIDSDASLGRNIGNVFGAAINYNLWMGPVWTAVPLIFGGGYDVNFVGTTFIPK